MGCVRVQAADLSHYALWAAVGGDVASSWGQREANPLVRTSSGGFNVGLSVGVTGAAYAATLKMEKGRARKVRWIIAGVRFGVVGYNLTRRR